MILQSVNVTIHLSHLHRYLSAYETTKETVADLETAIERAIDTAVRTHESQIVEQDSLDHIFVVHPSGTAALYRLVGEYEVSER